MEIIHTRQSLARTGVEGCEKFNENSPPGGPTLDCSNFKLTGTEEDYNREDKTSRFYYKVHESKIGIDISNELKIPWVAPTALFPKSLGDILTGGVFFNLSLSGGGNYGKEFQTRIDKSEIEELRNFFELEVTGSASLSGEFKFDPGKAIEIDSKIEAATSITIKGEYENNSCPENDEITAKIEYDPFLISGYITATLVDFDLLDYKFLDYKVFDRFEAKLGPASVGNCEN